MKICGKVAAAFALLTQVHAAEENNTPVRPRKLRPIRTQTEPCQLYERDIVYKTGSVESWVCKVQGQDATNAGATGSSTTVEIEGIEHVLEANPDIESGFTTLFADGAILKDHKLLIRKSNQLSFGSNERRRQLAQTGTRTVLAVRVRSNGSWTVSTSSQISDNIFGTGNDVINLKSQMEGCSHNQLIIQPASGTDIDDGVIEIDLDNAGTNIYNLEDDVENALENKFGGKLSDHWDHVMMCLPPNTGDDWIGYGYINGEKTVYNDDWCNYPSIQMHEIGHNLGLHHAGEGNDQYADQSGMMGYSYGYDEGANYIGHATQMCYNPAKSWQLGWYAAGSIEIQPQTTKWSGKLVGVANWDSGEDHKVILKMKDGSTGLYIGFNLATGHNYGTVESRNAVTVLEQDSGSSISYKKKELYEGEKYVIQDLNGDNKDVTVKVTKIVTGSEGYAYVLVYSETDDCGTCCHDYDCTPDCALATCSAGTCTLGADNCGTEEPSGEPSFFPSVAPTTLSPSTHPSIFPSAEPTLSPKPSDSPTNFHSFAPSESSKPSSNPSSSPSNLPSHSPSQHPSSHPTTPLPSSSPSDPPTLAPTVPIEIIDSENFESGMGIWNLGSDKESKRENRYVDALDPNLDPTFAVRLRKNKGVDSSFYTDVNVQDYTSLEIGFYFMFFDYDGDGFFLEYGVDGNNNNLNTLHYYQEGLDFHFPTDENKWFHQTVLLDVSEIQSVRICFRSAGEDKNSEVDIDYVNLTGRLAAADSIENESQAPSSSPSTASPSVTPSKAPSDKPSWRPSGAPSSAPTIPLPSAAPSRFPSSTPSLKLSKAPSSVPTNPLPSAAPSRSHSSMPSLKLSKAPSSVPTNPLPSAAPSLFPSSLPSAKPSKAPSAAPSAAPSRAPIAPSTWQRLNYEDFEQGMGIWREGGKEGKRDDRYVDALDPNLDPTFHVRLKKDKGESSSTYTSSINVESYTTIGVGFYFLADDMKGDGFYLEFALDGAAFTEVRDFQEGVDFDDSANTWYSYTGEDRIEMDVSSANQVVIRFRCAGSDKNSEVNIDHVSLWTKGATSGQDGILV